MYTIYDSCLIGDYACRCNYKHSYMHYSICKCILGLFYFMLGNIVPKYRSGLHTIQLLSVVETRILHKYSIHEILESFMSDIKQLESVSAFCMLHLYYNYIATCMHALKLHNYIIARYSYRFTSYSHVYIYTHIHTTEL